MGDRDGGPGPQPRIGDHWAEIRRAFDADRTLINLNNGGVCPSPTSLVEPPRTSRRDLARECGCGPEEMAITRHAPEGMRTLIAGIDLQRGDEVLATAQNYGRTCC